MDDCRVLLALGAWLAALGLVSSVLAIRAWIRLATAAREVAEIAISAPARRCPRCGAAPPEDPLQG